MCCTFCHTWGVAPFSVPPRAEGIAQFIAPSIVRGTHPNGAQRVLVVLLIWSLRQMPRARWALLDSIYLQLLDRHCSWDLTAVMDHSLESVYKRWKISGFLIFQRISRPLILGACLFQIFIYSPLPVCPTPQVFNAFSDPAFWINWHYKLCNLNKNIGRGSWALLHGPVTLMSVKGQSHISFLPWRINNVVVLAETGVSEPWAGSTLFSNLSSPKGPSSLVLFDSFIINVLQFCSPGQT